MSRTKLIKATVLLVALGVAITCLWPSKMDRVFFDGASMALVKTSCQSRGWQIQRVATASNNGFLDPRNVYQVTFPVYEPFWSGYCRVEFSINEQTGCIYQVKKSWFEFSF